MAEYFCIIGVEAEAACGSGLAALHAGLVVVE